jgi:HAD superfamily hydrolase (TIGR01450 family)
VSLFGKASNATPLDGVDAVLADLDGVVYAGPHAIAHAVESLNRAHETLRVGYITNNASRTDEQVAQHLRDLGLQLETADVVTSPQAAMGMLRDAAPEGSTILVVGGEGLINEVQKNGFTVTDSALDKPAAVIQGFAPHVGWKNLAEASFALNERAEGHPDGIPWIATNMDWTIPVERGVAPGNGTLVSAVHLATGRLPQVAGKPEIPIFDEAKKRFGAHSALFIGDRLDTDVMGANRAGMKSALVLTGIDQAKQLLAAPAGSRPDFILGDLRELHLPYPPTVVGKKGDVTVGKARISLIAGKDGMTDLVIELEGDSELDTLRAACAAIWNSGKAIFGFNVPEHLYS